MFIPCLWVFFHLPLSFPFIPEFHLMVIFKTLITEDISFSLLPTSIRIHSFGHATWYGLWETRGICMEPYWTINFHFNMTSEDIEVASVSSLGHMLIPPTWLIRREPLSLFFSSLSLCAQLHWYIPLHSFRITYEPDRCWGASRNVVLGPVMRGAHKVPTHWAWVRIYFRKIWTFLCFELALGV